MKIYLSVYKLCDKGYRGRPSQQQEGGVDKILPWGGLKRPMIFSIFSKYFIRKPFLGLAVLKK